MRLYQRLFSHRPLARLIGLLLFSSMFLFMTNAAAVTYAVVDLATLSISAPPVVRGPNTAGVAVGGGVVVSAGGAAGYRRGFVVASGAAARLVTGLAGTDDATVFGVNDAGGVV